MANPFTAEDKRKIDATLKAIADSRKDIARAKLAGINVSEAESRLKQAEDSLLKIKQVYLTPGS